MTVSPNWPQDGNPQHKVGGSGVEPNDRSRVASLPPTLFKLPNLAAISPPAKPVVATSPVDPSRSLELPTIAGNPADGLEELADQVHSLGELVSQRGSAESAAADWNLGSRPSPATTNPIQRPGSEDSSTLRQDRCANVAASDAEPAESIPKASSATTAQDSTSSTGSGPRPSIPDVPAGRSWMESLGSHGVVIVLLLIVVAAALLTGQGDEDPTAKSLSTQSELLDFDELNVDLPVPTHDGGVALAESKPAIAVESNSSSANEAAVASTPVATISDQLESAVQTQPIVASPEEQPMSSQADPVATLEAPQPVTSGSLDHDFNQGFLPNGVRTNDFVAPSGGVDAMIAANRVNTEEAESALPSLEELAGLQEQAVHAAEPTAATSAAPTRMLTKTPVGISDWSKYLPALNSAVEQEAGTSSLSNQVLQP